MCNILGTVAKCPTGASEASWANQELMSLLIVIHLRTTFFDSENKGRANGDPAFVDERPARATEIKLNALWNDLRPSQSIGRQRLPEPRFGSEKSD